MSEHAFKLRLVAAASLSVLLLGGRASAQQPGGGPPMPIAADLTKVAQGSYAEYAVTFAQMPAMKMRIALVGKGAAGEVLESSVEGGMMANVGKTVVQMTLPSNKDGRPTKMVMQIGNGDPMDMPIGMAQQGRFTKPDPKKLVKTETITVKAGSFKAKHYRHKTPQGDPLDFWIADNAPPLGLVKMQGEQNSNPMMKGPFSFELTTTGKDAKPVITKPPKPFDQQALMKQMMAGRGQGGPAPGAGAAPPAHPGAPGAPAAP